MQDKTDEKRVRTVRLSNDIDKRLVDLCEHLGTNPNSYLINEIGKAVSRDELAFKSQQNQADIVSMMMSLMSGAAGALEIDHESDSD